MELYVAKVERIIGKYYSNETFSNVLVYINNAACALYWNNNSIYLERTSSLIINFSIKKKYSSLYKIKGIYTTCICNQHSIINLSTSLDIVQCLMCCQCLGTGRWMSTIMKPRLSASGRDQNTESPQKLSTIAWEGIRSVRSTHYIYFSCLALPVPICLHTRSGSQKGTIILFVAVIFNFIVL